MKSPSLRNTCGKKGRGTGAKKGFYMDGRCYSGLKPTGRKEKRDRAKNSGRIGKALVLSPRERPHPGNIPFGGGNLVWEKGLKSGKEVAVGGRGNSSGKKPKTPSRGGLP